MAVRELPPSAPVVPLPLNVRRLPLVSVHECQRGAEGFCAVEIEHSHRHDSLQKYEHFKSAMLPINPSEQYSRCFTLPPRCERVPLAHLDICVTHCRLRLSVYLHWSRGNLNKNEGWPMSTISGFCRLCFWHVTELGLR